MTLTAERPAPNPCAFPIYERSGGELCVTDLGMTLRDWFAGQALSYLASDFKGSTFTSLARAAYALADAMLEERHTRGDQLYSL